MTKEEDKVTDIRHEASTLPESEVVVGYLSEYSRGMVNIEPSVLTEYWVNTGEHWLSVHRILVAAALSTGQPSLNTQRALTSMG